MRIEISSARASCVLGNGLLANLDDARSSSLLNPNGLFLGALNQRLLFYNGDAPLLTYARAGTGKGRDFILPNLAHVRNRSLIVIDVKDGENCFASFEHRSQTLGQRGRGYTHRLSNRRNRHRFNSYGFAVDELKKLLPRNLAYLNPDEMPERGLVNGDWIA